MEETEEKETKISTEMKENKENATTTTTTTNNNIRFSESVWEWLICTMLSCYNSASEKLNMDLFKVLKRKKERKKGNFLFLLLMRTYQG